MTESSSQSAASDPLEVRYHYQNPQTGQVTQLSLRQLCRLCCPRNGPPLPQAHVLAINSQEWKLASTVAILQQVVYLWYYQDSATGEAHGPISARELATLLQQHEPTRMAPTTRVYSELVGDWKSIAELTDLQTAMRAFETTVASTDTEPFVTQYDAAAMTYTETNDHAADQTEQVVHDELEAFLASTDGLGSSSKGQDEDEEEAYESDNGTRYVKDPRNGSWIHQALAALHNKAPGPTKKRPVPANGNHDSAQQQPPTTQKRKKSKFSSKNAKCWIYVTGLPTDATEEEVSTYFAKAGIIDLDPETQRPKVKLYRHKDGGALAGQHKGDASICYARPESVELAVTLLDESNFRLNGPSLRVERAKFEQQGTFDASKGRVNEAKRKVAKLATLQELDWDDGEINGRLTGGRKGLRIIVLKHLFHPSELSGDSEDTVLAELEKNVRTKCEKYGDIEKITVFSKNNQGVVVVKFIQPGAASEAVKELHGHTWENSRRIEAIFWDGVTDFTVRDEEGEAEDQKKRLDEFGAWIESQELPDELKLQTE